MHANVRANYLASPPLVVAYALLGKVTVDITTEPLGIGNDGKPVYLKDVWPTNKEIADVVAASLSREQFLKRYGEVFKGPKQWQTIAVDTDSETYRWSDGSTYVKNPPYFEGFGMQPPAVVDVKGARCSADLGDSITTDHISPAGCIRDRPQANTCWNGVSVCTGLQHLRRAARESRSDDARHVRERSHQEPHAARHRRRHHESPSVRRADVDL